jgi:hypothetical protein
MTNIRRLAFASALVLAILLASASAGATVPRGTVKAARGPVQALAMDGGRVAYDVGNSRSSSGAGNKVLVWNVLTGRTTQVSGKLTSAADVTSTGRGVGELAIAGARVAWIVNHGGNTESDDSLYASSVTTPKERRIATARRSGEATSGDFQGNWIGGLVGSGGRIAANRWATDATGSAAEAELDLVGTRSLTRIASGTETLVAAAADGGRIAVARSDGTLVVYSSRGRQLLTVTPPSTVEVALAGNYLLVLTKTRTLELYDSRTGAHRKTLPVRGGRETAQNLDLQATLAVYTLGRELHVVNLATRRDSVLATMSRRIEFAQIEAPGVVYAGNVPNAGAGAGTLVYVPFARVAATVS